MGLSYELAASLYRQGEFVQLIAASGRNETERRSLEPTTRAVVANALVLAGYVDEAARLAKLNQSVMPAGSRAQAEWTLALANWRLGDIVSALQHARAAIRFAFESNDSERIAW